MSILQGTSLMDDPLKESLVMLMGLSWALKFIALLGTKFEAHYGKKMFAITLP